MTEQHDEQFRPNGNGTRHERDPIDRTAESSAMDADVVEADQDIDNVTAKAGQTTFEPEDADNTQRFEQLLERNQGKYDWSGSEELWRNMQFDARLVASRLNFTDYQKKELLRRLWNTDFLDLGSPRYEAVVIAHTSLIANEDGRWIQNMDVQVGDPDAGKFHGIREDFGVSQDRLRQLRKKLR